MLSKFASGTAWATVILLAIALMNTTARAAGETQIMWTIYLDNSDKNADYDIAVQDAGVCGPVETKHMERGKGVAVKATPQLLSQGALPQATLTWITTRRHDPKNTASSASDERCWGGSATFHEDKSALGLVPMKPGDGAKAGSCKLPACSKAQPKPWTIGLKNSDRNRSFDITIQDTYACGPVVKQYVREGGDVSMKAVPRFMGAGALPNAKISWVMTSHHDPKNSAARASDDKCWGGDAYLHQDYDRVDLYSGGEGGKPGSCKLPSCSK